jgi:hypothetical protein
MYKERHTIAPAVTSRRMLLQATKEDHTPYAVPIFVGSLIRIGIEPTNGITFNESAKLESTIGPVGCTLVRPIKAKTTM